MTGRKHSNGELALANAGAEHLRTINTFSSELEVVKHIIEYNGLGEAHCALEEALRRSMIYKEWQDCQTVYNTFH